MTTVSFVIPALNAAATLAALLRSIKAQVTDLTYEIIVVDNGSTDGTADLARALGAQVCSETVPGAGAARNAGAAVARGEYLAFVDSDVELHFAWLETVLKPMRQSGYLIGLGKVIPVGPASFFQSYRLHLNQVRYHGSFTSINGPDGNVNPIVNTAACVYHRELFLALGGFDVRLHRLEDTALSGHAFSYARAIYAAPGAVAWVKNTSGLLSYLGRSYVLGRAKAQLYRFYLRDPFVPYFRDFLLPLLNMNALERAFYFLNFVVNFAGFCREIFLRKRLSPPPLRKHVYLLFRRHWNVQINEQKFYLAAPAVVIQYGSLFRFSRFDGSGRHVDCEAGELPAMCDWLLEHGYLSSACFLVGMMISF